MMKLVFGLVLLFLMSVYPVSASNAEWIWIFHHGGTATFGTATGASDGSDAADALISENQDRFMGTYREKGVDSWTGDTGFYSTDIRSPLTLAPGETKTWTFYLWASPTYSYSSFGFTWGYGVPYPAFDKMEYRLTYVRAAEGITQGSAVGTSILLNERVQGSWNLPVYRTTDGRTGYMFEFTATVIPEPSCFAGVATGFLGLGCLALRRRGRRT